jgi:hypothetical protein
VKITVHAITKNRIRSRMWTFIRGFQGGWESPVGVIVVFRWWVSCVILGFLNCMRPMNVELPRFCPENGNPRIGTTRHQRTNLSSCLNCAQPGLVMMRNPFVGHERRVQLLGYHPNPNTDHCKLARQDWTLLDFPAKHAFETLWGLKEYSKANGPAGIVFFSLSPLPLVLLPVPALSLPRFAFPPPSITLLGTLNNPFASVYCTARPPP